MGKPRISFHDFTCCEGCQLQVLNCEDELLGILGAVDIVQFREAIDNREWECDIAFIEGAFSRESDRPRLEKIRANAKLVVALGACATTGGLNVLKNYRGVEKAMKTVYGDKAAWYETCPVQPIGAIIPVDGGIGAAATAVLNPFTVASVDVLNGGSGYTSPPIVTFSGGGGQGAQATAQISGGQITGIHGGLHPQESRAVLSFGWQGASQAQLGVLRHAAQAVVGGRLSSLADMAPILKIIYDW